LELGPIMLEQVTADMYLGDQGAFASADADANLGSGVLKAFIATFDYANRRLSLAPGAEAYIDAGYDRLGMWFNLGGEGVLDVVAVTAGGPAEVAGLKTGDRIVQIDRQPVHARGLAEWRSFARGVALGSTLELALQDGRLIKLEPQALVP
jgi:predicted metalloprotease with PDZ domain